MKNHSLRPLKSTASRKKTIRRSKPKFKSVDDRKSPDEIARPISPAHFTKPSWGWPLF
jgi:hypothetical protein